RSATTSVRYRGGSDVRTCRPLCLCAAPFDLLQGRVRLLRVRFGALGSDHSAGRAGVYGVGPVPYRMRLTASFALATARGNVRAVNGADSPIKPVPSRAVASVATQPTP